MNKVLRLIYVLLALLGCRIASAEISYDGFEKLSYEISFRKVTEENGESILSFQGLDDRGRYIYESIRSGSYFLGATPVIKRRHSLDSAPFATWSTPVGTQPTPTPRSIH